jgi:cellulose biosynthesis protein BcsQ
MAMLVARSHSDAPASRHHPTDMHTLAISNQKGGVGKTTAEPTQPGYQPRHRPRRPAKRTLLVDMDLVGAEVDLLSAIGGQTRLRAALAKLDTPYDYILIDTPPSLGLLTINALAAADQVIIAISISLFALKGLAQLQETIARVRESLDRPSLAIRGILPTLYDHIKMAQEVIGDA